MAAQGNPPGSEAIMRQEPVMDEWARKGATLSDKTAREEYGLTQDEIEDAIRAGKLQYRFASMHGNPWLRLLRRDVENLVTALHGDRQLRERQARAELARIDRELKRLRAQMVELEQRRSELAEELSGMNSGGSRPAACHSHHADQLQCISQRWVPYRTSRSGRFVILRRVSAKSAKTP